MAYWKLEEASGTRVDEVGSNDLTDRNTVTQGTGKHGNCASFAQANSEYLDIADNADMNANGTDFSVNFWIKPLNASEQSGLCGKYQQSAGPSEEWECYRTSTDLLAGSTWDGSGGRNWFDSGTDTIDEDVWSMVTLRFTLSSKNMCVQINDGTENNNVMTTAPQNSAHPFNIGRPVDGIAAGYLDGLIDSFGWWKRVLTDSEVTDLYASGSGLDYPFTASSSRPRIANVI